MERAAEAFRPYALDLSSSVETDGVKDPGKNKKTDGNDQEKRYRMKKGRYGIYGGQYISETLMNELIHLEEQYEYYKKDPAFQEELHRLLVEYAGRPSLLYYAEKMTKDLGGERFI